MSEFSKTLMGLSIAIILAFGLTGIRAAIDRSTSAYLCIESAKLGLKPADCSKLLDHRP